MIQLRQSSTLVGHFPYFCLIFVCYFNFYCPFFFFYFLLLFSIPSDCCQCLPIDSEPVSTNSQSPSPVEMKQRNSHGVSSHAIARLILVQFLIDSPSFQILRTYLFTWRLITRFQGIGFFFSSLPRPWPKPSNIYRFNASLLYVTALEGQWVEW